MEPTFHDLISAEELHSILHQSNVVILDCRYQLNDLSAGRKQYLKSHIPGAYFMDIGLDLSAPVVKGITGRHPLPEPELLTSALRSAGLNTDSRVIVYDQANGGYASRAWWLLHWLDHPYVAILNGGMDAWIRSQFPVDNVWPAPKHGNFQPQIDATLIMDRNEVRKRKDSLIDSREYKRYTGEVEPIDPVAGHIPGAVCLPYTDNTDTQGFWKSKEWLQQKFREVEMDSQEMPVFYCGSGVTACHNILAYHIATGKMAKLYPGSFSEWINYYPVEKSV